MTMQIVPREEEILDPNLPIIERIGKMARLCYKVESEPSLDVDCRIIKKCIESGHESILEHGVISVFINPEITEDSKRFAQYTKSKTPFGLRTLWDYAMTDACNKYLESFHDVDIYDKWKVIHNIDDQERKMLPVVVGDVRAWRQVMRERFFMSIQQGDKLQYILCLKVLHELDKVDGMHVLFGDLVNDQNEILQDAERRKRMLFETEVATDEKGNPVWNVKNIVDFYFKEINTVIATTASASASMSVIITTDRATTHQLVRHRKNVAYSQESQRYVNYGKKGCCAVPMVIDPKKAKDGVKVDPITGEIQEGCPVYDVWKTSVEESFENYEKLLEMGVPTESARGVLPNDAKTKIGITWMRHSGFMNFNFWRLDSHAQYAIRAMAFRIVYKAFKMHHQFMSSVPYNIVMKWLNAMIEQNVIEDKEDVKKIMKEREQLQKLVMEYIQKNKGVPPKK